MEISIYGLHDPITNEIRYVGKTKQPLKKRLSQHLWVKNISNPHKFNWIEKLKNKGLKPNIILLEICDELNWVEREKYWIRSIDNLTNLTYGGEDGLFFSDDILTKISIGVKKAWEDPIYREKMSEIRTRYWSNQDNRDKQSLKIIGTNRSDEHKKILSEKMYLQWLNDDYKLKMSNQSKKLWLNDDYKENVLKYLKSDEHKKNVSKRFKGKKLSDEHKDKMSKSSKNKQPIMVDGVKYDSINEASKLIPINRDKLKGRLKSNNFPNYYKC